MTILSGGFKGLKAQGSKVQGKKRRIGLEARKLRNL
jgi:hypothetical protein